MHSGVSNTTQPFSLESGVLRSDSMAFQASVAVQTRGVGLRGEAVW
jgi:hypothetical protein